MTRNKKSQRPADADDDFAPGVLDRAADRILGNAGLRRASGIFAWSALTAAAVFVGAVAMPSLMATRFSEADSTGDVQLLLVDAPEWYEQTPQLHAELEHLVLATASNGPTDRAGLTHAHTALAQTGWFRSIDRLERNADGTLSLHATLVRPFGLVRYGNWDHLIDEDGRLLDWPYPSGTASSSLPLVVGVPTPPPTDGAGELAYGRTWGESPSVEAGLALALLLASGEHAWLNEVEAIDVGEYEQSQQLWIKLASGPRICFGLSPATPSASEIPAERKLATIDWIYACYDGFASLNTEEIDIRHDVATRSIGTTAVAGTP